MSSKLPIGNIVIGALYLSWKHRTAYSRAIVAPTLILVLIWAASNFLAKYESQIVNICLVVIYGIGFSLFAVTCHRIILLGQNDLYTRFNYFIRKREIKFFGWIVVIYAFMAFIQMISMTIYLNIDAPVEKAPSSDEMYWIGMLFKIPALYILARLCLIFPGTAIDEKVGLKWSWAATEGNGWRIFVLVGLLPWIISSLIWLVWREDATVTEQIILTLVTYITFAIEVFLISLTYKEITKKYVNETKTT